MNIAMWLVVAALIAGCTTIDLERTYTKTGAGTQASWDEWQCSREVEDSVRTPDLIIGGAADAVRIAMETEARDLTLGQCMEARGYQPSSPGGWAAFLRDRWERLRL